MAWFIFCLILLGMAFTAVSAYNIPQTGEALAPPFYSGILFAVLTILWLALSYKKYLSKIEGG